MKSLNSIVLRHIFFKLFFQVSGKLIYKPEDWNTTPTKASPHADYDFDTFSPIKNFKFIK